MDGVPEPDEISGLDGVVELDEISGLDGLLRINEISELDGASELVENSELGELYDNKVLGLLDRIAGNCTFSVDLVGSAKSSGLLNMFFGFVEKSEFAMPF